MSNCFFEFHFFSVSPFELVSMYKSLAQSCPTPCDPVDYSLPGSSVHGIQTRTLEWVAIPFSRGSSWPRDRTWVSCIALLFVPPGKPPVNTKILIIFLFFFKKRIVGWFVNVKLTFSSVQFSRSVVSDSLQPHESQHAKPPCNIRMDATNNRYQF